MKKIFTLILVAVLALGTAVGCGGGTTKPAGGGASGASGS